MEEDHAPVRHRWDRYRWLLAASALAAVVVVGLVVVSGGDGFGGDDRGRAPLGGWTSCGSVVAREGPPSTTARLLPPGPVEEVDPLESDDFEIPGPASPRPNGPTLGVFVDGVEREPSIEGCTVDLDGDAVVVRFGWPARGRQLVHVTVQELPVDVDTLVVGGRRFPIER